ncbi:MAG: hypothetical protein WBC44_12675 [Planctomycetaceae bacterium]
MSTNVSFCGKATLCLVLLTAGFLRSAVAGQLDETQLRHAGLATADGVVTVGQSR